MTADWSEVALPKASTPVTAAGVAQGPVIPPQQQLLLYSPSQWEDFVQEWVYYCLKKQYRQVQRFTGSGDRGIDIAGFADNKKLQGVWDNYQCKHYDNALRPTNVWVEIGKMIWYTYQKEYTPPRRYYFVAPKGTGTSLTALLADTTKLREELIANWEKYVQTAITKSQEIPLNAPLLAYVNAFDFSIFDAKTAIQLVEDHQTSPAHAARFGGGLKPRPEAAKPPEAIATEESRYVIRLLRAYADHLKRPIGCPDDLATATRLKDHFRRQREAFYHAEALRLFARDSVPMGVFESLQEDIYDGVVDVHDAGHPDGYVRVCAVTKAARDLQITSNALISCIKPKDRDGICHQLANEDRLSWTQS